MKGVDYSKQIAKERNYMQDAVVKNRQAMEKRLEDNEARNEHIQNKQLDNFVKDRADLEKSHQKSLENIKEKTTAAIESKNDNYQKKMEDQRNEFKKVSESKSKDFDRRLNDIKGSYDKSANSQKQNNELLEKSNKDRYNKNIKDLRATQEQKLADYQHKMHGAGADLKESNNRQREQLVRSHSENMNDLRLQESEKRAKQNDKIARDIKLTNEKNEADIGQIRTYTDDKVKRLNQYNSEQNDNIARDYSQKADELASSAQRESFNANRESKDKALEQQRGFDKQLRAIELDKRRRDNGSAEFNEVNNKQLGLKEQDVLNNRISNLKTALKDTQKDYENMTNKDRYGYQETLRQESSEATLRKDRAVNDLNAEKIVQMAKERDKHTEAIGTREYINRLDKQASEQQIMYERKVGEDRAKNLKENFNVAMTKLEESNRDTVEKMSKVAKEDQAKFIRDMNDKRSKEIWDLKRDFGQSMDKTIQNYEQQLAMSKRENEVLKNTMSQKVENIMDQTDKKLEAERSLYQERRKAETQDYQVAMDQREHKLRTEMNTVIVNYQRKLDKMTVDNETKMKLLTNNYENKLKELNAVKGREMVQKEATHQTEVQRLKEAYADEKARLTDAYENKITGIISGHEERMLQLDEFKKLS